ncbi:MAG: hypothetical protein HY902_17885, partial [Deltaproteobacteria bacterium]|nr:hypothetical protein [Deltaproteobacteria bacterium]
MVSLRSLSPLLFALFFSACQTDPTSLTGVVTVASPAPVHENANQDLAGPICLPKPPAWSLPPLSLPDGVLAAECPLVAMRSDADADGKPEAVTSYTRADGTLLVKTMQAGYPAGESTEYQLDSQGRAVAVTRRSAAGLPLYAELRSYDSAGRLLVYEVKGWSGKSSAKPTYGQRIQQQWQGENLVSRQTLDQSGTVQDELRWHYDGRGRLVGAERQQGTQSLPAAQVEWHYDALDRPVLVVRRLHGKESLRASWTWGAGQHLLARTVELHLGLGGISERLDDYDAPTGSNGAGACYGCAGASQAGTAPWADAMPAAHDGCQPVPTAVGHGYPEADYAVVGPWNDVTAPTKPASGGAKDGGSLYGAYGYYGYGYGYGGGNSWYGHAGPGSNWDALAVQVPHTAAVFEIQYDDLGRMVREHLRVTPTDAASLAPRDLLRQRVYGDRGLERDEVTDPATGKTLRSLLFARS